MGPPAKAGEDWWLLPWQNPDWSSGFGWDKCLTHIEVVMDFRKRVEAEEDNIEEIAKWLDDAAPQERLNAREV